jgi:hypothetical protein
VYSMGKSPWDGAPKLHSPEGDRLFTFAQFSFFDIVSKTEQQRPSSSRILGADSPTGGTMLGYGLLGTIVVIAVIVVVIRAL